MCIHCNLWDLDLTLVQFTAPDLSAIASSLDTMEQSYDDNNRGTSTNMDDTGMFSYVVAKPCSKLLRFFFCSGIRECITCLGFKVCNKNAYVSNLTLGSVYCVGEAKLCVHIRIALSE